MQYIMKVFITFNAEDYTIDFDGSEDNRTTFRYHHRKPVIKRFIKELERKVGIDFNRVDLYDDEELVTISRLNMLEKLKDNIHLTMIVHSSPCRVMDTDVIRCKGLGIDVEKMIERFGDPAKWDVSFITDMSYWFLSNKTFNEDIRNWNVSSVENMSDMFKDSIFSHNLTSWNVYSLRMKCPMLFNNSENMEFNRICSGTIFDWFCAMN